MAWSGRIKWVGTMNDGATPQMGRASNVGNMSSAVGTSHPERYILGKPHPDRAKQFKPFAALRGYEELVAEEMRAIDSRRDFSDMEESC